MAEFFLNWGLFAAKTLTILLTVGVIIGILVAVFSRNHDASSDRLVVTQINRRIEHEKEVLSHALLDSETFEAVEKKKRSAEKAERKQRKKSLKAEIKSASVEKISEPQKRRVYVLDFDGDLQASAVSKLRRELTSVLAAASTQDEIVVRLESGGGVVHGYGLAASQLARVKAKSVKLTVCVDKVAASGGYMMACVADHIVAAPFAVLGSIGVVAQLPNFHRLLKKHDVDFEMITAGAYKRTLTVFGENTESGREKFREDIEDTHAQFKEFVSEQRPGLDIEKVATGEIWLGRRALDVRLVDELKTSDEYIVEACENADVYEVRFEEKKKFQDKLMASFETSLERVVGRLWQRSTSDHLS